MNETTSPREYVDEIDRTCPDCGEVAENYTIGRLGGYDGRWYCPTDEDECERWTFPEGAARNKGT